MEDEVKTTDGTKELTIDSLFDEAMTPASHQKDESVETEGKSVEKQEPTEEGVASVESEYTDEEFKSINFDKIDPKKVPEKFKQSYEFAVEKAKNLEKAYNEKFMSLADQRRQFEQSMQEESSRRVNGDPQSWLIQQFDKNPSGVVAELDNEIISRKNNLEMLKIEVMSDPYAEGVEQKRDALIKGLQDINKLETHRRGLDQYVAQKNTAQRQTQQLQEAESRVAAEVIDEIRKGFPEFDKKRDEINKFAVNDLGYTEEQIGALTNPVRLSLLHRMPIADAKKLAMANYNVVMKLYNNSKLLEAGKNKIKQGVPKPLAKGGTSSDVETDTENMSFDEMDKYLTSKNL